MSRNRDAQSRRYGVAPTQSLWSGLRATSIWKRVRSYFRSSRVIVDRWHAENTAASETSALAGLASPVARCRWESAAVLGRNSQRTSAAIGALTIALADPFEFVRWQAAAALSAQEAGRVFPTLVRSLEDADALRRAGGAEALGLLGGEAAGLALERHVADPSPLVRSAVAEAIGNVNDPVRAPILIPMLSDPEPDVRRAAAAALGHLRAPCSQGPLAEALAAPGQPLLVRRALAAAIAAAPHPDAQDGLIVALRDPDEQVRAYAASALGHVGGDRAYGALSAIRADESRVLPGTVGDRARAAMVLIERRGRKEPGATPANIATS